MPLSPFQREVARLLAGNRNPDSHFAGGAALNRGDASLRYSEDLDLFHDAAEQVAIAAAEDERCLREAGYWLSWELRREGFFRAVAGRGDDRLRLDWSHDSAWRFFPIVPDEEFGYCLHPADLAVNKVLALAGRTELRDFLDILELDAAFLRLGALIWAACGKDPGYTPDLILQLTNIHSRYTEADLASERLARPVDLKLLKKRWIEARRDAEALARALPPEELGCLYIGGLGEPITPNPSDPTFPTLVRHFPSVRGAWPRFRDVIP